MNLYSEATGLMNAVLDATKGLEDGQLPGLYEIRSLHGKLVSVYGRLAEQTKPVYKSRVRAYMDRKIQQAEIFKRNRVDEKMTASDADKFSLLSVGDEFQREIESDAEYEGHRAIMQAVARAIDFVDRVCSDLKYAEGKPVSNTTL